MQVLMTERQFVLMFVSYQYPVKLHRSFYSSPASPFRRGCCGSTLPISHNHIATLIIMRTCDHAPIIILKSYIMCVFACVQVCLAPSHCVTLSESLRSAKLPADLATLCSMLANWQRYPYKMLARLISKVVAAACYRVHPMRLRNPTLDMCTGRGRADPAEISPTLQWMRHASTHAHVVPAVGWRQGGHLSVEGAFGRLDYVWREFVEPASHNNKQFKSRVTTGSTAPCIWLWN